MDSARADKRIRNAWIAGVLSVFLCILTLILIYFIEFLTIYTPKPWVLSYNIIESFFWLLFILLIILGAYKRYKLAVIFLFLFYCLDKLIALISVMERWKPFEIIYWVIISLLFGYFFFQGFRGAFAYRRSEEPKEPKAEAS
jgi:hypothetical protein